MADKTFDPVAMGLVPTYGTQGQGQDTTQGAQTGWAQGRGDVGGWGATDKLAENEYINYDMNGNVTAKGFHDPSGMGKFLATGAALMATAGVLGGAFLGGGELATAGAIPVDAGSLAAAAGGTVTTAGAAGTVADVASAATPFESGFTGTGAISGAAGTGVDVGAGAALGTGAATAAPSIAAPAVTDAATGAVGATAGTIPVDAGSLAAGGSTLGTIPVDAGSLAAAGGAPVTTGTGSLFGSATDSVSAWLKANPGLATIAAGMLSGAGAAAGSTNVANINAQSALDQLNLKETEKIAQQKRFSDSVTGMAKPGLISSHPLKRLDGTPVFNQYGLINRG